MMYLKRVLGITAFALCVAAIAGAQEPEMFLPLFDVAAGIGNPAAGDV